MATEDVPAYTEIDEGGFASWLENLPDRQTSILQLPITQWPVPAWHLLDEAPRPGTGADNTETPARRFTRQEIDELYMTQTRIITTLFESIRSKNDEAVRLLISRGWVSPDVPNNNGETPLIAAVDAGNGAMVCLLVSLGAQPNLYGRYIGLERTPLMVAALLGRLPLVRLLREDFGADDAIIAPDGQLALRLAADAGHREVVDYLPARRGGAFRRWQVHHHVAVMRIKAAARALYRFFRFFLYDVPRFFLWSVPKHVVVKPLGKASRYCWENKARFGRWCQRQVLATPGRAKRASAAVWRGVKKVPRAIIRGTKAVPGVVSDVAKAVWDVAKEIPGIVEKIAKSLWRFLTVKIPRALKAVAVWAWTCLKRFGLATADVFLKVVSLLHTAVVAVLDWFRNIKVADVWNGCKAVLRAVFVGLPVAVWDGLLATGKMASKVLIGLFGGLGMLLVWTVQGLFLLVTYVVAEVMTMVSAAVGSAAKAYHEVMVWMNPKH